jgi:hypothetical protein
MGIGARYKKSRFNLSGALEWRMLQGLAPQNRLTSLRAGDDIDAESIELAAPVRFFFD